MITRLVSSVHHRRCHCPVTKKTVEVRIRDIETIKQQEDWHGHIRILSRTLEDCSGISECGIIRTIEGGSFIINWQRCPLSASLQTGRQVWNSCLPTSSFSPSMYETFSWEGIT
ncbi:MAG: hypothetical protein Q3M24_08550 [Candidatus Electrothrix aestuarii]|uniref:Uncharacterized protein n=1 Tax=Candidatus Electrothrix aestuarii TaxID=3062594 RepID=A0AAU8M164_9BACT|nr:hypothetical protein [Candidatus Electrothrix aestuarii]WPD23720.1 MAG: hypothetical protein SD837_03970 [Candidatus Electrothrix sp. GW3-3]